MNDSVREELESKISSGRLSRKEPKAMTTPEPQLRPPTPALPKPDIPRRAVTAGLVSQKTSQTLVEFQSKNALLPDWRIQLQNAVQQRKGGRADAVMPAVSDSESQPVSRGNLALKTEATPQHKIETAPNISDPRVVKAILRIEASRSNFMEAPANQVRPASPVQNVQMRPFGIVSPNSNGSAVASPMLKTPQKPKLVNSPPPVAEKRDTNKLPLIKTCVEETKVIEKPIIERVEKIESGQLAIQFPESKRIHITAENVVLDDLEIPNIDTDEIEDLAPFSMRFGAGLFDFIIGGFAAMLMLSPLAFTSGNWFTATGLMTFVGTWAMVTFLYMAACLGLFGKTMGMRLFQLELVDAVENEYPTLRQASVNSAVFLISIFFAGAGFLTIFFNEERRALHDLMSGTILVREF